MCGQLQEVVTSGGMSLNKSVNLDFDAKTNKNKLKDFSQIQHCDTQIKILGSTGSDPIQNSG